jgi:hypothetical protein
MSEEQNARLVKLCSLFPVGIIISISAKGAFALLSWFPTPALRWRRMLRYARSFAHSLTHAEASFEKLAQRLCVPGIYCLVKLLEPLPI